MISSGAGRPGIAAVVMMMSCLAAFSAERIANLIVLLVGERAGVAALAFGVVDEVELQGAAAERRDLLLDRRRTSKPVTMAPSRLAVAIACNPATPAPRTSTLAGGTVPEWRGYRRSRRQNDSAPSSPASTLARGLGRIASLGGRPLELDFIPDAEAEGGYARPLTDEENEKVREALAENAASART